MHKHSDGSFRTLMCAQTVVQNSGIDLFLPIINAVYPPHCFQAKTIGKKIIMENHIPIGEEKKIYMMIFFTLQSCCEKGFVEV